MGNVVLARSPSCLRGYWLVATEKRLEGKADHVCGEFGEFAGCVAVKDNLVATTDCHLSARLLLIGFALGGNLLGIGVLLDRL